MLCESADSRIQVNKLGVTGGQLTRDPRTTDNPPWLQAEPLERELPRRETG